MVKVERDGSGLPLKGLLEDAGLPGSQRQHCVWFVIEVCQLAESVRGGLLLCQNKRRKVKSHKICHFKNNKALSRHNKAWR